MIQKLLADNIIKEMSQMTNEINYNVHCNDQTGSQLNDEGNGVGMVLKKGKNWFMEDNISRHKKTS